MDRWTPEEEKLGDTLSKDELAVCRTTGTLPSVFIQTKKDEAAEAERAKRQQGTR